MPSPETVAAAIIDAGATWRARNVGAPPEPNRRTGGELAVTFRGETIRHGVSPVWDAAETTR
jgi:hypothetical protein